MIKAKFVFAAAVALVSGIVLADTRASADYTLSPDTIDSAGGPSASADYSLVGSLDDLGSTISANSADFTLWNGYVAQLEGTADTSLPALQFVTAPELPFGQPGIAYARTLAVSGGTPPYLFAVVGGSLPAGLTLSGNGLLSGTPTARGTSAFTVTVYDNDSHSATRGFTLPVVGTNFVWDGSTGDWADSFRWTPTGVPGPQDVATIGGGNVTVSDDRAVGSLQLAGATLTGTGTLTVSNVMNWTSGNMTGPYVGAGRTVIAPGAVLNAGSASNVEVTRRALENAGTVLWSGTGNFRVWDGVLITNRPGALFEALSDTAMTDAGSGNGSRFDNAGIFRKRIGTGTTTGIGNPFNNYGTVDIQTGTLSMSTTYHAIPGNRLKIGVGGADPGQYGTLAASGPMALTGTLEVSLNNGYLPPSGTVFTIMTYGSVSGSFDSMIGLSQPHGVYLQPNIGSTALTLTVLPPPSLTASTGSGTLGLSWPAEASTYLLQSTTNLVNGPWTNIPLAPGVHQFGVGTTDAPAKFFRLVAP